MRDYKLVRGARPMTESRGLRHEDCSMYNVLLPDDYGSGIFTSLRYARTKRVLASDGGEILRNWDILIHTHYGKPRNIVPKVTMVIDADYRCITPHYQTIILRTHPDAKMHQAAWLKYLLSPQGTSTLLGCIKNGILQVKLWKLALDAVQLYCHSESMFDDAVKNASVAAYLEHMSMELFDNMAGQLPYGRKV